MSHLRKVTTGILFLFIVQSSGLYAQRFYQDLQDYCDQLAKEASSVPAPRKDSLKIIGDLLLEQQRDNSPATVMFTGRDNGSISQAAEIWLYTALHYYKLKNIKVYSGGIRPAAINYRIVAALKRCGFYIMPAGGYSDNPVYFLNLGRNYPDYTFFAKLIDYYTNPRDHYLVIPVLLEADSADYHRYGAERTIPYHWYNPSLWDDTAVESIKYDACIHEIGRDLFFLAGYLRDRIKSDKKKKKHRRGT